MTRNKWIVSLLAAALLCLLVPVLAVADVIEINETNFPDDVFMKWVLDHYDKDQSCTLSESEIEDTTEIMMCGL